MKSLIRNYLVNAVIVCIFTGWGLWLALKDHTEEIMNTLLNVDVGKVLVVILVVLFCQLIVGWILQQYAKIVKKDYSLKEGFVNALVASFFHGITPSSSGGQIAQVFVFHKQGLVVEHSASILVIDFIVYQITMVLVSLILLVWKIPYFMNCSIFLLAILGFGVNAIVIGVLILCTFSKKVYTWILHVAIAFLARIKIVKDEESVREKMRVKLIEFSKGITVLRSNGKLLIKVVLANIFRLLMYYAIPIFCLWALDFPFEKIDFVTMIALTSFVMNVNAFIPIPGASGGTESVFMMMFGMLLSSVQVSSVMVLWRFTTYHLLMILGAIVFIKVQNSKTKVVEEGLV